MKRIGKIFLGVLCAAALAAGGFWINDRLSYPIDPGMDGLEGSLKNWLNRGIDAVHGYQPRLYEPVTLGERTYVPMEVGRSWATLCWSGASPADIGSPTPLPETPPFGAV